MDLSVLKEISSNFQQELSLANAGQQTSLPFIINPRSSKSIIKNGEIFQVMVIGGSIFKTALIKKQKNNLKILKLKQNKLPLFSTKNSLLSYINKYIEDNINILGINFAFGLSPKLKHGILDGSNPIPSKRHTFTGFRNQYLGEEISKYHFQKSRRKIKISIANDTICLLFSSLTDLSYKNAAAGVVGTGMNFAFFVSENNAVNLESAHFNKFPQSNNGKKIDLTHERGLHLFEKEVAGAYLYQHFNLVIKDRKIDYPEITETAALSKIAQQENNKIAKIAKEILERSAQLLACQIAGIVLFKKKNLIFVIEGNLFWKGYNYKETVNKTLKKIIPKYKTDFVYIKNSDIIGAAKLLA